MTAGQLINWGMPALAADMLNALDCQRTLPLYLQASLLPKAERGELVAKAIDAFPQFVRFPNTLEEVAALESIEECWFARHLLACFYYNKRSYGKAIALWQRCVEMSPEFADGWRGLAIHAWNKQHDYELAARYLDNAYQLAPQDARLLFERDLLDKLSGVTPEKRLARLENNLEIALKRDDMTAELLNLWHLTGQADKAADILATRKFHPWEGGEGKVTSQFILNQLLRAWQHLDDREPQQASELLHAALHYPENLSEGVYRGKLTTTSGSGRQYAPTRRAMKLKRRVVYVWRRPAIAPLTSTVITTISRLIISSGKEWRCDCWANNKLHSNCLVK